MNSNIKDDNEWETDEEQTQFLRINFENASKINTEINKRKKYHIKKIKGLEKKEIDSALEVEKYIKNNILPNFSIKTDLNNNKPYLSIGKNDYIINDKPEVGTNVFFSYNENKKRLEILGKSERFLESKIFKVKKRISTKKNVLINQAKKINRIQQIKKLKNKNSGEIDTEINTSKNSEGDNKNVTNKNVKLIGNKRNRRQKRKYIKESTIINIKKIN